MEAPTTVFGQEFAETITKTWRSGEISEYRAHKLDCGLFIAIQRGALREFDPTIDRYDGPELRVMDADGHDVGISATVYGPEVRYSEEIRVGSVNWSAVGTVDPLVTQASAHCLMIASYMAQNWTEAAMPNLIHELALEMDERRDRRAKSEQEAEQRKQTLHRLEDPTGTVRVKEQGRKTFHIGRITMKASGASYLHVDTGSKIHKIHVDKIEYADVKLSSGSYQRYYTKPITTEA